MTRTLTCDTAIADVVIALNAPDKQAQLLEHWRALHQELWAPKGTSKVTIDDLTRNALLAELAEIYGLDATLIADVNNPDEHIARPALHRVLNRLKEKGAIEIQPGGTALNIVQTLAKAFNPQTLDVTLLTSLGTGPVGDVLKSALNLDKEPRIIRIEPEALSDARTAMSLVYLQNNPSDPSKTKRDIAKFDGNFSDTVTPEKTKHALSKKADAVLLLGTLLQKNKPMFDALFDKATHDKTDLYFAMPTAKEITQHHATDIKTCLSHARVVLSNYEEIGYLFGLDDQATPEQVRAHLREFEALLSDGCRAFITLGKDGAWILEKGKTPLTHIPLWSQTANIDPPTAKNTVGAGDNAFAGFLMGHLAGHDAVTSAHMGMAMAHTRLTQDSAQVEKPAQVYTQACNVLKIDPTDQHLDLVIQSIRSMNAPAPEVSHAK